MTRTMPPSRFRRGSAAAGAAGDPANEGDMLSHVKPHAAARIRWREVRRWAGSGPSALGPAERESARRDQPLFGSDMDPKRTLRTREKLGTIRGIAPPPEG